MGWSSAEDALREGQQAGATLLGSLPGMAYRCRNDRDWTMEFVSQGCLALTGYAQDDLIGNRTIAYNDLIHPDDREPVWNAVQAAVAEHKPFELSYRIAAADGSLKWVSEQGAGVFAEDGSLAALEGFVVDVTEQRRLRELRDAIYEISDATQTAASLEELFRTIHSVIGRLMPAKNFYIALYDAATDLLSFPYFVDEMDARPAPFSPGRGMTSYVLRTGRPLLATPEVLAALIERREIEPLGAPSIDWLGVPLKVRGTTIGVLVVQSYSGTVRYSESDRDILAYVSAEVARAIDHKRSEDAVREAEERFRGAFEAAPIGMAIADREGRFVEVNQTFCELFGYSESELLARTFKDLTHPDDLAASADLVGRMLAGEIRTCQVEKRYLHKAGHALWALLGLSLVRDAAGRPLNFVSQVLDLSPLRQAQEALAHAQKMEAIGRLAGGVAHDFNNLLQAMLSRTQLLRSRQHDPHGAGAIAGELEEHIRRAAALTRQLLLFSRRESTKPERLDLNEVVEHGVRMLRRLVREDIGFELRQTDGKLPIEADLGQMEQVLMNLVVNAADAMPGGGTITISTGRAEKCMWLEVCDTGHGIPAEVLPRIFEPFFTTKVADKGTGLGLAVVHGIVTAHGGAVAAESTVGAGTKVRVTLPYAGSGAFSEVRRSATGDRAPGGGGERVLVVEDESAARAALAEILLALGYSVVAVGSAEEAGLLPEKEAFDLLLTDLVLPGAHGSDLARGLLDRWPSLKVVFMSGYTDDEVLKAHVRGGTARFLQKPFDMDTLARELRAELDEPD